MGFVSSGFLCTWREATVGAMLTKMCILLTRSPRHRRHHLVRSLAYLLGRHSVQNLQ